MRTEVARSLAILGEVEACRSRQDFMDVLSSILLNSDKTEKGRHLALLFADWLEQDSEAAISEVRRVELLRHDWSRTGGAFQKWATENSPEALGLLAKILDGRQSDPASSPPFLDGVDPPGFLLSIVYGLSLSEPLAAGQLLAKIPDSPVRINAMEVLAQSWFAEEPEQVYEWAASVTDPKIRDQALGIAGTKAGQLGDPALGVAWAQALPNEKDQLSALRPLINQWADHRPEDALGWAAQLPDGNVKFEVMPDIISSLTITNPDAAADWLDQYEASPQLDNSVEAYALSIGQWSPQVGLGSSDVITDPAQRERTLLRIYQNWSVTDPEGSQAYLDNEPNLPRGLRELVSP